MGSSSGGATDFSSCSAVYLESFLLGATYASRTCLETPSDELVPSESWLPLAPPPSLPHPPLPPPASPSIHPPMAHPSEPYIDVLRPPAPRSPSPLFPTTSAGQNEDGASVSGGLNGGDEEPLSQKTVDMSQRVAMYAMAATIVLVLALLASLICRRHRHQVAAKLKAACPRLARSLWSDSGGSYFGSSHSRARPIRAVMRSPVPPRWQPPSEVRGQMGTVAHARTRASHSGWKAVRAAVASNGGWKGPTQVDPV